MVTRPLPSVALLPPRRRAMVASRHHGLTEHPTMAMVASRLDGDDDGRLRAFAPSSRLDDGRRSSSATPSDAREMLRLYDAALPAR